MHLRLRHPHLLHQRRLAAKHTSPLKAEVLPGAEQFPSHTVMAARKVWVTFPRGHKALHLADQADEAGSINVDVTP